VLTILLGAIYGIGLVGRIPYVVATVLYVFVFVTLFEYHYDQPFQSQKKTVFWALIQAVLVAGIVAAVFRYLFLVDLP
jgi:putative tricarboxylic transport membrane protein